MEERKLNFHYDVDFDVVSISWGRKSDVYDGSDDFWNLKVILDFSTENNVMGIEIFNWSKREKYFSREEGKVIIVFDNISTAEKIENFEMGILFLGDNHRPLRLEFFNPSDEFLKELQIYNQ